MDFIAYGKRKILQFIDRIPVGQDYIPFVNPDGTHCKTLVSDLPFKEPTVAYSIGEIRDFTGQTDSVYYVKGNGDKTIALYRAGDLASDNGTSVIVTDDDRRYYLLTQTEYNDKVAAAVNLWDVI